jgi:hypothetical protein
VSTVSDQEMSRHGVYADRVNVPAVALLPRPADMDAVTAQPCGRRT